MNILKECKAPKEHLPSFHWYNDYYWKMDHDITMELNEFIRLGQLYYYSEYFDDPSKCFFVNAKGKEKLLREWPSVWEKFGLEADS